MPDPTGPVIATPLGVLSWRPRGDDDQGLLRALFASQRRTELAMLGGDVEQQAAFVDLQMRARDHHRDATRPGAELGIVTLDGIAVGQLDLHRTDALEVLEIALVPGLQGHGLGTALLTHLLAAADAEGRPVRLHVEAGNPARRLYERLGFVAVGTQGIHTAMERPAAGAAPAAAPAAVPGAGPASGPAAEDPVVSPLPTYEQLAGHLGATVALLPDGPDLELVAVDPRPRGRPGPMPYSALLAGPVEAPLPQGTQRLDLPGSGPVEVFIVPLAPQDGRAIYELIVS
ncbi:MAG TPA: GNAT family N-acetyltransferase [Iamia sp.]|nr:GNAT family N-acetyltransferase [Iamia sp.]